MLSGQGFRMITTKSVNYSNLGVNSKQLDMVALQTSNPGPLCDREKVKVAHHLPDTVCESLVFSSLGACTPATLRRLPRGGAAKGASKVIRPHAREIGLQTISKALLNSVIARFFAFEERSSGFDYIGAGVVRLPSAREQRREEVAADSAAAVAVPRASSARGDVPPDGDVVET